MSKEKKIFQLEKKEICITSSQIKQAIDLLVNENEILREEIKRLKEEYIMLQNASDEVEEEKDKEIERLNSIIKEVREYCINRSQYFNEARIEQYTFSREEEYSIENILEILDKVGDEK